MASSIALWRDRKGRVSPLRVATLAVLFWPLALAIYDGWRGGLGGRPLNELIHRAGWWALIFLLLSLAVTPLRRSAQFGRLIDVRRMIGVAAFAYAAAHLCLYITDQNFDVLKVAREIVTRLYLTIGFVALLGLALLAATSNDTMVRRLGGLRWWQIHQIVFVIGLLAFIHYFQQTKADLTVPTLYAGLFAWLVGYRLVARSIGEVNITPLVLAILSVVVAALVFAGEAAGIAIAFGVSPWMVLASAFDTTLGVRPGWWVLAAGLAVAILDLLRRTQPNEARAAPAKGRAVPSERPARSG